MTPRNPGVASATPTRCRQRTDLVATRTGLPAARRTRSAAFARKASRSTTANGASSALVARSISSYRDAGAVMNRTLTAVLRKKQGCAEAGPLETECVHVDRGKGPGNAEGPTSGGAFRECLSGGVLL